MVRERKRIKDYFLLDVEFPYLFKKARAGEMDISIDFLKMNVFKLFKNI